MRLSRTLAVVGVVRQRSTKTRENRKRRRLGMVDLGDIGGLAVPWIRGETWKLGGRVS